MAIKAISCLDWKYVDMRPDENLLHAKKGPEGPLFLIAELQQ